MPRYALVTDVPLYDQHGNRRDLTIDLDASPARNFGLSDIGRFGGNVISWVGSPEAIGSAVAGPLGAPLGRWMAGKAKPPAPPTQAPPPASVAPPPPSEGYTFPPTLPPGYMQQPPVMAMPPYVQQPPVMAMPPYMQQPPVMAMPPYMQQPPVMAPIYIDAATGQQIPPELLGGYTLAY